MRFPIPPSTDKKNIKAVWLPVAQWQWLRSESARRKITIRALLVKIIDEFRPKQ